ncbi:hypothetical protein ACFC09_15260 [Streptomyces sp. NPDC056161]|uniref:hypothetical protein n=1 Tax=Streptomyces sp. NPDC056161 TaxID=3345732 RepID=UPI0035DA7FA3
MSGVDALVIVGPVISALETFPVWGPVLALVAVVLFIQAARMTWGTGVEDTRGDGVPVVPAAVPEVEGTGEDTLVLRGVTCGDAVPRPGSGGAS